ncbi:MAG: PfkB family carbohydrate kinase, partial [Chloroflexota bacterium]
QSPDGPSLGGTATYASLIAAVLGKRVGLLTGASFEPGLIDVLGDVRVARLPAEDTTRFTNTYEKLVRRQKVETVAPSLSARQLLPEWRDAPIVHLAPVAREVENDFISAFPKAFMGVTPQGWMRTWDASGIVQPCAWTNANAIINRANAIVLSIDDVVDQSHIDQWAAKAKVLVVTHGAAGAVVYVQGRAEHSAAFASGNVVDPTGSGDFFAAAFFIRLAESGEPLASADFANCVASFAVERRGHEAVPTAEQIQERWAAGKRLSNRPAGF